MERKHPRSPSETLEQLEPAPKHPKLILKPPEFLVAKQKPSDLPKDVSQHLEAMLKLETPEEVTEQLLKLIEIGKEGKPWTAITAEEISKCLSALGKMVKCHRKDISHCCVLVHVLEVLLEHWYDKQAGVLPKNVQTFILSLLDHGK